MLHYLVKVIVSALIIVAVSELGKRSSLWAAVLASLPLTSLLAVVWLRLEGAPVQQMAQLSTSIFWLVLPSLLLFVVFPVLLTRGVGFTASLLAACAATAAAYVLMGWILPKLGVRL